MNRFNTGLAIGALTLLTASVAAQTPYPNKPIRLIVPIAAGGPKPWRDPAIPAPATFRRDQNTGLIRPVGRPGVRRSAAGVWASTNGKIPKIPCRRDSIGDGQTCAAAASRQEAAPVMAKECRGTWAFTHFGVSP